MEKTLKGIQTFAKIGKILSRIVFVCCIVGIVFCLIGIAGLKFLPEEIFLGSVSITGIASVSEEITIGTLYAAFAAIIIVCIGECIVSQSAVSYFKYELKQGTPFTLDGAKKLKKLGILSIVIPIVAIIVSNVAFILISGMLDGVTQFEFNDTFSIGTGIGMILVSMLLKYGAQAMGQQES